MTKPKPRPKNAVDAACAALEKEEKKRGANLKPIEIVKVALSAYQAYNFSPSDKPRVLAESNDRETLRRGTQAAMDRLLFNVNYWRSAYEDRIVVACDDKQDALALLGAICAWNTHTMKLNTLHESQVREQFSRFCPLVENNRRGRASKNARGKGPVAEFVLKAKEIAGHLPEERRAALEFVVAEVEAEAEIYERHREGDPLDAFYEILPAWRLQDKIELVTASWWNDADMMMLIARKMSERFAEMGKPEAYCTYFVDMVSEALDGYQREIDDVPEELSGKSMEELLALLAKVRRDHPESETDGYGDALPAWLNYKEQLIWNIIACAIFGPEHARPFMTDSVGVEPLDGSEESMDSITRMAKIAYGMYLAVRQASDVETEFKSFEQLPEDLHRSSVERIASFPDMLRVLGYRLLPPCELLSRAEG